MRTELDTVKAKVTSGFKEDKAGYKRVLMGVFVDLSNLSKKTAWLVRSILMQT